MILVVPSSTAMGQEALEPTLDISDDREGADVLGAFTDSFKLLMIEHGWRVAFQEKTRSQLGGNFWSDHRRSVRIPKQWEDTDAGWVNYIGHPIHGAGAGYIWLDHEPQAPSDFRNDSSYWSSRGRGRMVGGVQPAVEIGPLSEASIGNVGMKPETTGWIDHVVTPVGAFGLIVAEDALDKYLVKRLESRVGNRFARMLIRLAFNPAALCRTPPPAVHRGIGMADRSTGAERRIRGEVHSEVNTRIRLGFTYACSPTVSRSCSYWSRPTST